MISENCRPHLRMHGYCGFGGLESGTAEGVVGFVCGATSAERDIIAGRRTHLPSYAVPRKIIAVDAMPLNANGKVDRNALRKTYLAGK